MFNVCNECILMLFEKEVIGPDPKAQNQFNLFITRFSLTLKRFGRPCVRRDGKWTSWAAAPPPACVTQGRTHRGNHPGIARGILKTFLLIQLYSYTVPVRFSCIRYYMYSIFKVPKCEIFYRSGIS
jgi:hypothetical protein